MYLWNVPENSKNRATGEIFETPQVAYMMISKLFAKYSEKE